MVSAPSLPEKLPKPVADNTRWQGMMIGIELAPQAFPSGVSTLAIVTAGEYLGRTLYNECKMDLGVIPVEKSLLIARYKLQRLDGLSGVAELDVTLSGRGRIRANNHSYLAMHRLVGERSLYLSSGRSIVADADRKRWHNVSTIEVYSAGETIVMRNESLWSPNQIISSGERQTGFYTLQNDRTKRAKLSIPDRWGLHIAAFLVWIELRGRYLISG